MTKNGKPYHSILLTGILLFAFVAQVYFVREQAGSSTIRRTAETETGGVVNVAGRRKNDNQQDWREEQLMPLDILTDEEGSTKITCPPNTTLVLNNPVNTSDLSHYKIPMVIHQGCKSRCVSHELYELSQKWKAFGIPYYFHDDAAVDRLVYSSLPEFPQLQLVWEHCIAKPVVKSDIWRMVLLYKYGGIYADLDSTPVSFEPTRNIFPEDEMYTLTEPSFLPTYHFLASMPGHSIPLLTVHEILKFLLFVGDTGIYNPARRTGPGAIRNAIANFGKEPEGNHRIQLKESGKNDTGNFTFRGLNGQTMRREGFFKEPKSIVNPCAFSSGDQKVKEYKAANVTHYGGWYGPKASTGVSCFELITKHFSNTNAQKTATN